MHRVAKVVSTASTRFAGAASYSRLESYPVASSEVLHILTTLFHNTCRLMTEDDGLLDDISANASVLPVMNLFRESACLTQMYLGRVSTHIRPAQSCRYDSDANMSG